MAQVLKTQNKQRGGRNVFSAISDKKTRVILEILYANKAMTYTEIFNDWIEMFPELKQKSRSGSVFAYHIRKLKQYYLIDQSMQNYMLSFRGKKVYTAISIINQACSIKIANFPSCLKIRISNPLDDEELLNAAVKRVVAEVKKLK